MGDKIQLKTEQKNIFLPDEILANVPDGLAPFILAQLAMEQIKRDNSSKVALIYIARDGERLLRMEQILCQLMPKQKIITIPAWDCLPYDRASPNAVSLATRMSALSTLINEKTKNAIVLSTVNVLIQKLVPRQFVAKMSLSLKIGEVIDSQQIIDWANMNGYLRVPIVREGGEYSVRGGLIDIFLAGHKRPVRLDFFGTQLESIRIFDPKTQRTLKGQDFIELTPISEVCLTEETIRNFRREFSKNFNINRNKQPLFQAISSGQRYMGMEHWLPFFYDKLDRLVDYCGMAPFVLDEQSENAFYARKEQIIDYYRARKNAQSGDDKFENIYQPINPELLYEIHSSRREIFADNKIIALSPFLISSDNIKVKNIGGSIAPSFQKMREGGRANIFHSVAKLAQSEAKRGKKLIICCWSKGSRERMAQILSDYGLKTYLASNWHMARKVNLGVVALLLLPLESGYRHKNILVLSEQDILGERFIRPSKRNKANNALTEISALAKNDIVVHIDHGIGRFIGLKAIEVGGAPHDCVEIEYARNDRLYLPVENIDLLSRYGSEQANIELDRLGGAAWQAKKAKLKKRIRDMAEQLIRIAAEREMSKAQPIEYNEAIYEEFISRFAFDETEDQLQAIEDVISDLTSGKIMDRLICGDVGFGKTEIALRAAFLVALSGQQVAIIVPTTLLARQHYKTFKERFAGLPVKIEQASRLVGAKKLKQVREGIANGTIDIVIGTHALLSKSVKFFSLGLMVVDEEQHFGVAHKERLKELRSNVHVLTLSATPIPRTLQLALSGVRSLSLLASPPLDRLAVRTFIMPFDEISIREALLREKYRSGQSFYVVPRISDQQQIAKFLREQVPEVSFIIANGQMPPNQLDDIMNGFYDGKYDVLLTTSIVESGLDIPNANSLIVHRADKFGLAQLYQIRGRIGRSKIRAYAIFTYPGDRKLTEKAQKRLEILQSLEHLGAGFELASHDLDIRGAGNLLGDEQSGHIKEVGFELYQSMLEEAVMAMKKGKVEVDEGKDNSHWSPQISLGLPVMIPDDYVADLPVRMQLYRRLGELEGSEQIDEFGAELIDRFGPLPDEVKSLLKIVLIKSICRKANIEKIEAGPKGAIISLRNNEFPNPAGLVDLIADSSQMVRLRADQKIVFTREWPKAEDRLVGVRAIVAKLEKIARKEKIY